MVTRLSSWTISAAATAPAASAVSGRLPSAAGARQVVEAVAGARAALEAVWLSAPAELARSAALVVFGSATTPSGSVSPSSPSRSRLPLPGGAGARAFVGDITWRKTATRKKQQKP